jgi:HK97 family phage major capsid protein
MPYTDVIDRGWNAASGTLLGGEAGALIPEDVSKEIMKGVTEKSAALKLFRHRDMGRAQTRLPVLNVLPTAYFVAGDAGFKQTTAASWTNVYLNAEEIAAIAIIPEKVLDDSDYDLWGEMKPLLEEAIAVALDDAIFFGTNKPASWPTAIVTAAAAAGNVVRAGTSAVDLADDINNVMAAVEADGYIPNGHFARIQMRAKLRGLRDAQKNFLFQPDNQANLQNMPLQFGTLMNEPITFSRGGFTSFATTADLWSLITGDWTQGVIGIRQDITYKMLDQSVITDGATPPVIQYNLPQQDLLAMRVVARFGFAVPNPVNRLNATASRYPFGALQQKATTGGE